MAAAFGATKMVAFGATEMVRRVEELPQEVDLTSPRSSLFNPPATDVYPECSSRNGAARLARCFARLPLVRCSG
jgi:hypothetical protein